MKIAIVAAEDDPYLPGGWWKLGCQVKWVLAEYGAFLYLLWNKCDRIDNRFAVLPDQKQGCILIQKE